MHWLPEIGLFDLLSSSSISGSQCTNFSYNKGFSIDVANILQNVEKSYDKGKFLLEETKKHAEIVAEFCKFYFSKEKHSKKP